MTGQGLLIASAITVAVLLLVPAMGTAAQVILVADNGMFEHIYRSSGPTNLDTIQFLWVPEGVPGSTIYGLAGSCKRIKASTGFIGGNHKARFMRVWMTGLDSESSLRVPNRTSRIRQGLPFTPALWDITLAGAEFAATDSAVLVTARVRMRGRIQAGDYIQCFLGVVEGDATALPPTSSEAERLIVLEELVMSTVHPRSEVPAE